MVEKKSNNNIIEENYRYIRLEHPSVQAILKIAEEIIIGKNKVLDVKLLYYLSKKQLKLPRKGILDIINFLLNEKVLIEGSRLTRNSILSNQYRKRIYDFIINNIGSNFSLIRDKVHVDNNGNIGSPGHLAWHIEILLKFNFIKKIKYKNYTILAPNNLDDNEIIYYFLLRDKLNNEIIRVLIEYDQIKKSELHNHLNIQREIIYYRMNNLLEHKIILTSNNPHKIFINPIIKDKIIEILYNIKKDEN